MLPLVSAVQVRPPSSEATRKMSVLSAGLLLTCAMRST